MVEPGDDIPTAVSRTLVRVQQVLVKAGYTYSAGDPATWPLCPVFLVREDRLLIIEPWRPGGAEDVAERWQVIRRQVGSAGLLLIGTVPTDDGEVARFFDATGGAVGYVDANTMRFRLRRPFAVLRDAPGVLRKRTLRMVLDPRRAARAGRVDCLESLTGSLEFARQAAWFDAAVQRTTTGRRPVLTVALMVACIAVFLLMARTAGQWRWFSPEVLLAWGANYGPLIAQGQWWRLVACAFLHAGLMHLVFNMVALWVLGGPLERWQGRGRFAAIYLFTIVTASLASLWWRPHTISVGASGAVFGLIGGLIALTVRHYRDFPPPMAAGLRRGLVTVLLYNVVFALLPGIDVAAHVGGLLGGLTLGLIISRSPVRRAPLSVAAWLATAALLLLVAGLGWRLLG